MADTLPPAEMLGQALPPSLSAEAIADYRRLLNDAAFARDYPTQHAALKASVAQALAVTGQNLEPPPAPAYSRLSPETVAYERGLLASDEFRTNFPDHAAMLETTLAAAITNANPSNNTEKR